MKLTDQFSGNFQLHMRLIDKTILDILKWRFFHFILYLFKYIFFRKINLLQMFPKNQLTFLENVK